MLALFFFTALATRKQRQLGHSKPSVTLDTYGHPIKGARRSSGQGDRGLAEIIATETATRMAQGFPPSNLCSAYCMGGAWNEKPLKKIEGTV